MIKPMNTPLPQNPYPPESVGARMSTNVPIFATDVPVKQVVDALLKQRWDSIRHIYVVDNEQRLQGIVTVAQAQLGKQQQPLGDIMQPVRTKLHPHVDQETAVFSAIKHDETAIPVVDRHGHFLGAIAEGAIIDIMHEEHVEDAMLSAGLRADQTGLLRLTSNRIGLIVSSRAPWLIGGLLMGMGLGLITSFFEQTLEASIALAFFIPVIAYIADSVGTQSSTITVRALATMHLRYGHYIIKELFVGMALGLILGTLGSIGAFVISQSPEVALVVGLTLLCASTIASVLSAVVPMSLKALGKDPALGSGPLATVIQDILSLLIYFLFAIMIISS